MIKKINILFSLGKFLFEEAILAILFFWILPQFNSQLPFWLAVAIMLLYAVYYCIVSFLISKISKRRTIVGIESLINSKCRTVTILNPEGYVKVGNELWRACSLSGNIRSGDEVEIENVKGLILIVKNPNLDNSIKRA